MNNMFEIKGIGKIQIEPVDKQLYELVDDEISPARKKITKEDIDKALEQIFKNNPPPKERTINFHRGCNTYGLIKAFDDNGFVNWCKNERCQSCKGFMKQFNELFKEQVNIILEGWKINK